MKWLKKFQAWKAERARRRTMQSIRESMTWFGYPLDHMTDKEIEEGVKRMGEVAAECGVSAEQLNEAARFMGLLYVIPSEAKEIMDTPQRALEAGRVLGVVNEIGKQIRDQ